MALDAKSILAADDARLEKMAVPEWGGDVYIRVISGGDRDRFEDSYADQKLRAFRVRFLVLTLCDEKGDRLFADDQVDLLAKKSSVVINRVFEAAWKLNAFSQEAVDELGESSGGGLKNASSTN